jgi:putative ABC transport system permease protein
VTAGRDFEVEHTSDWFVSSESKSQASILITESLTRLSGFKTAEDAVGQTFLRGGLNLRIVGVVEDVLLGNIRESYSQVLFICGFTLTPNMNVLLTHQPDISLLQQIALINNIKEVLAEELNVFEPNISLVSDNANANLDADKRLLNIISMFGVLVIIIACVGVFGLASFATHQRRREVAMRKVLGATRLSIVNLLAKEFLLLVGISVAFAWPLTYWLMAQWLQEFNQRISQSIWVYLLATIIVVMVTWLTVASLAFKAASERPSKVLKNE